MPAVIILWSQLYHILFFLTKLQQPSTHLRVALATPLNFALISTWHVCHEKYFTFLSRATTTIMGDPNIFTACNIFAWQWNIFSLLSRPTISRSRSSCSCRSCWRPTRSATRTEQCGEKRRRNTRPRCQYSDPGWMRRTCDNQSLRATISSLLTPTPGQPESWPAGLPLLCWEISARMKLCAASDVMIEYTSLCPTRGVKTAAQTWPQCHGMLQNGHWTAAKYADCWTMLRQCWRESDLIIHLESQLHWNLWYRICNSSLCDYISLWLGKLYLRKVMFVPSLITTSNWLGSNNLVFYAKFKTQNDCMLIFHKPLKVIQIKENNSIAQNTCNKYSRKIIKSQQHIWFLA